MFVIEFDTKFHKFGYMNTKPSGRRFFRVWGAWFALAWVNKSFAEVIRDANQNIIHWPKPDGTDPYAHIPMRDRYWMQD